MIRPAHHGVEVWLCVEPVDFRKQITGLATLVQDQLSKDPFSALRNPVKVISRSTLKVIIDSTVSDHLSERSDAGA